jgi:hypothetical protein
VPSFTIAANISSTTGLPGIKATASCAPIKGKIDKHLYDIADLGIEIELTPRPPSANPKPVPVPVKPSVTVRKPNWDYLTGVLLITGAGLLIVATIGEDVLTAGVGTADDAPSFAAASAIFATGLAMTRSVPGQQPIKMENSEL